MILEFDVGNSALKWRLLDAAGAVARRGNLASTGQLHEVSESVARVSRLRVASVAADETAAAIESWAHSALGVEVEFARTAAAFGGLINSYAEPERMGVDRWLAMLAAYVPRRSAVLVIDAGTAVTLDYVDADGRHRGGYILPGQRLSRSALLRDTSRVRFSEDVDVLPLPGCSTAEAVSNGALFVLVAAVESAIRQAQEVWGRQFSVVLTGGDGGEILRHVNTGSLDCEFAPDLVFEGLGIALP